MHVVPPLMSRAPAAAPQAIAANGASVPGFQLASLTGAPDPIAVRGVSSTASPALGAQAISTLLQTQEQSQIQARGGHGGGGHHGNLSAQPSLEAEEAEAGEEAKTARLRKKPAKKIQTAEASNIRQTDANDVDAEQKGETPPSNEENSLN